jgi:hypothetical protein
MFFVTVAASTLAQAAIGTDALLLWSNFHTQSASLVHGELPTAAQNSRLPWFKKKAD